MSDDPLLADIRETAEELVRAVDKAGYVLTVEQVPRQPLAMGNYETVVSVRPKRAVVITRSDTTTASPASRP